MVEQTGPEKQVQYSAPQPLKCNDDHVSVSFFLTLVVWLYLAILFTRSWSLTFCTPWCLPWTPGFLKQPRIFPWLWVMWRRWVTTWTEEPVTWFVGVTFPSVAPPRKSLDGNAVCRKPKEDSTQFSRSFSVKEQHTERWGDSLMHNKSIKDLILSALFFFWQVDEVIENVFFSFKSKLNEWADQKSFGLLVKKVTQKYICQSVFS